MARLLALASLCFVLAACEHAAVAGAVCATSSECAAPLACRLGRCRNECAASRDCPVGARCLLDTAGLGACSIASDDRCESGGTSCATGLTCIGGRCVNTCTDAAECPTDGECREAAGSGISFCFAPEREDGGALPDDAGPDDAGTDDASTDASTRSCGTASCALDVCIGEAFVCAVRGDRHVVCWGSNELGQLGDGANVSTPSTHAAHDCVDAVGADIDCSALPVEVLRADGGGPLLATSIACAAATACAREAATGRVYCWGDGGNGELTGLGPAARALQLTNVRGDVQTLSGGRAFFCATFAAPDAPACWGDDSFGQFGLPAGAPVSPSLVPHWADRELVLGGTATCGLDATGVVWCAGSNLYGEIGPNGAEPVQYGPVVVPVGGSASTVRTGDSFACALVDGVAKCWGFNLTSSLGRATPITCGTGMDEVCPDEQPQPVSTTAAGDRFDTLWVEGFTSRVCGRRRGSSEVLCWGVYSQIGCEAGSSCASPRAFAPLEGATMVVTSTRSTCAILASGSLVCGGNNFYGQLGRGSVGAAYELTDYVAVCLAGPC